MSCSASAERKPGRLLTDIMKGVVLVGVMTFRSNFRGLKAARPGNYSEHGVRPSAACPDLSRDGDSPT